MNRHKDFRGNYIDYAKFKPTRRKMTPMLARPIVRMSRPIIPAPYMHVPSHATTSKSSHRKRHTPRKIRPAPHPRVSSRANSNLEQLNLNTLKAKLVTNLSNMKKHTNRIKHNHE
jgi:hypothetical protein